MQARALDRPVVVVGVSEPDLGPLLCRLLREAAYDTTLATDGVAVVSAAIQQKARHLGAVAILRKPFQNSELLDALARACRAENEAKGV